MKPLGDIVSVAPRFQRSSRIDSDLSAANIRSIVVTETHRQVLEYLAGNSRGGGAFIIAGAYGCGKSTLCLLLSSLLAGQSALVQAARSAIGARQADSLRKRIVGGQAALNTLSVIGRQEKAHAVVREAMIKDRLAPRTLRNSPKSVLAALEKAAARKGLLLIIDEMGKFLEYAAQGNDDAIFLQELAEMASRSEGRLLFLGILHQSFAAYADMLPEMTKREWGKIHGRFRDIPLQLTRNEQICLLSKAIQTARLPAKTAEAYARCAKSLPREIAAAFAGNSCYPLHPLSACLITDIANSGIGQNQRTLFSFISTGEQGGLREFLESGVRIGDMLYPSRLWRYISESSLAAQSSAFGHKLSIAQDCLEKASKLGDPLCVEILRFLSVAWIFGRSNLQPTRKLIRAAFAPMQSAKKVDAAISLLLDSSVAIERRVDGRVIPYQGSDFDIEAALSSIGCRDIKAYRPQGDRPAIAHRHAIKTGTLRYAYIYLLGSQTRLPPAIAPLAREFACLCLLLEGETAPSCHDGRLVISAVPENREQIRRHMQDLQGLESLLAQPEVAGDAVARNEIRTRIDATDSRLGYCIDQALETARWRTEKGPIRGGKLLSHMLSDQADRMFDGRIVVNNELINRHKPSASAKSAAGRLMELLLTKSDSQRLGMIGWPAEAGIYESVVKKLGFHRKIRGSWQICVPEDKAIQTLWERTREMLVGKGRVGIKDIHQFWGQPPFGLPAGIQPLFSFLFYLTNRDYLSVYVNDLYQTRIDSEWLIPNWLHTKDICLHWLDLSKMPVNTVQVCKRALAAVGVKTAGDCLEIARALVAWADRLPAWTHTNTALSQKARKLLLQIRKAKDPNDLLLEVIPDMVGRQLVSQKSKGPQAQRALIKLLKEIDSCYALMLDEVRTDILRALRESDHGWAGLKGRFEKLADTPGDMRIRTLIRRLCETGDDRNVEDILALAAGVPADKFTETMIKEARIDLDAMLGRILAIELHSAASRKADMVSIAMVGINGAVRPVVVEDLVSSREKKSIDSLYRIIDKAISSSADGMSRGAKLAALLKAVSKHCSNRRARANA